MSPKTIQLYFKGQPPIALRQFLEKLNASSDRPELKLGLVKHFIGKKCFLLDPRSTPFNWRGRGKVLRVVQIEARAHLLCSQLEAMYRALARFAADPQWLTLDEVITRTGWTRSRVWSYVDEDCTYLGRMLDHRKAMRLNKDGRLCEILVYSAADVGMIQRVIAEREAAAAADGVSTLNMKQAKKLYKTSAPRLRSTGVGKKMLTGRSGKGLLHFNRAVTEKKLEEMKKRQEERALPVPAIVNAKGTWHPTKAAQEIAGCSGTYLEMLESGKSPCPSGVKIERLPGEHKNHRGDPQNYWLEGPLHALRDAPGRRMTAALRKARALASANGNGQALIAGGDAPPPAPPTPYSGDATWRQPYVAPQRADDDMIRVSVAATRLGVNPGQITRAADEDAIADNDKSGSLRRVSWQSCQRWNTNRTAKAELKALRTLA